jgi:hypothetical protein
VARGGGPRRWPLKGTGSPLTRDTTADTSPLPGTASARASSPSRLRSRPSSSRELTSTVIELTPAPNHLSPFQSSVRLLTRSPRQGGPSSTS